MGSEDYLQALETMGKILLFTPLLLGLLLFITGLSDSTPASQDPAFASGLIMSAGFFTLVYAAVLRFLEGKREAKTGNGKEK
ncbi:hypothetical protein FTO70_10505 [Methanosarcina sp. KYL-1]|uniref:hypothetical protein n=1 Tax=Methanosarcina sp. KYL-1 TaxID=2602068 RepID=UPI002100B28D|nr:hypothetical protein [Methanosarcina sp. KYL-1]MCQ1536102.1 hypothetical protein [Methanosarcina sp. KYL-1]